MGEEGRRGGVLQPARRAAPRHAGLRLNAVVGCFIATLYFVIYKQHNAVAATAGVE